MATRPAIYLSTHYPKAATVTMYRYGDFPELFWDADPAAPLDVEHPVALTRILTRGSMDVLVRLVSPALIARKMPALQLSEPARAFWTRVVAGFPAPGVPSASSPPAGASAS
ncbi:MAG: hypothetical protein HYW52_05360 [Gemmatimonadetes bacterium]|nr:hypothetical protein [Gemmatimonadota bacterium]